MESHFLGTFEHSLDAKGRVILPAKHRGAFARGGYLGRQPGGCLALWTPEDFEVQRQQMLERDRQGGDQRNLVRFWSSGVTDVEVDQKSGRMVIPAFLREYAQLEPETEVLVIGAIDRVEFWNPALYAEKVASQEAQLMAE